MALQYWFPLTQDSRQQGLNLVAPTIMGTGITFVAGKLGKAAQFPNNCNSCINVPGLKLQTGSWAAWVKVLGSGATSRQCLISEGRDSYNDGVEFYTSQAGTTLYFKAHAVVVSTTIVLNTWYHIVGTFGNNSIKLYVDGVLKASKTYTDDMTYTYSNDRFVLGKMAYSYTSTGSYFAYNGCLNDVRVYDHVLSQMEVKELSKGLVLHYPLNRGGWGQENLLPCGGTYIQSSPRSTTFNKVDGNAWVPNSAFEATPGKTYTISVKCDGTLASSHAKSTDPSVKSWTLWLYICNTDTTKAWQSGSYDTPVNLNSVNNNYRKIGNTHVWTYTLSSTQKYISLRTNSYSNGTDDVTVNWWNMKIEEGGEFTGWSPNSSSTLATTMDLNSTTEYDCSGFDNNGTRIGTFSWTSDCPKYSVSQVFASGNNYIDCGASQEVLPTDGLTVNLWINYSTWGNPISCTEGGGWNFENSSGIRFPVYVVSVGYKMAESGVAISTLQNGWHMLTGTFDKTNVKIYIDGVLKATTATGSTNGIGYATNHCYIGAEAARSTSIASAALVGKLSDVRIYATALSADDIKSLYQNSAYIDSSGNIYGAVHEEV